MKRPIFSEDDSFGATQYLFDFYMDVQSDPLGLGRLSYGLTFSFWG
jgi:hypothetical protein